MVNRLRPIGPGALVTAAFVGPGTVTACTVAGARYGYALLWALVFATVATIVLQEMAARLGVVTQKGLGESVREALAHSVLKWPLFGLIGVALYLGNAAYEAGNLAGAALGVEAIAGARAGPFAFQAAVAVVAVIAATVLVVGGRRFIEAVLIGLVLMMAAAFAATAVVVRPDLAALARGLATPAIPPGGLLTVIALIGTTVVPYNLFLHAAAAKATWRGVADLPQARADAAATISVGGLIAILIVSTAAASLFAQGLAVTDAGDMARQFEPLFGPLSRHLMGAGIVAAGVSSAITAPLATAHAVAEVLGWTGGAASWRFRAVMLSVVAAGASFALTGVKPVTIIVAAQAANGFLLPIIAGFLLFAMNQKRALGAHANGVAANIAGAAVVAVAAGLGLRQVLRAIGLV